MDVMYQQAFCTLSGAKCSISREKATCSNEDSDILSKKNEDSDRVILDGDVNNEIAQETYTLR